MPPDDDDDDDERDNDDDDDDAISENKSSWKPIKINRSSRFLCRVGGHMAICHPMMRMMMIMMASLKTNIESNFFLNYLGI